jgi:predicted DNA-binding transcriptional regulator AlpA
MDDLTLLTKKDVQQMMRIGETSLWRRMNPAHPQYDKQFPLPIKSTGRKLLWVRSELANYIQLCCERRLER